MWLICLATDKRKMYLPLRSPAEADSGRAVCVFDVYMLFITLLPNVYF